MVTNEFEIGRFWLLKRFTTNIYFVSVIREDFIKVKDRYFDIFIFSVNVYASVYT